MARHEREEFTMEFKVGDKVKQKNSGPYQSRVPGLVGKVTAISPERAYPISVNFPALDEGTWEFKPEELKKVEDE